MLLYDLNVLIEQAAQNNNIEQLLLLLTCIENDDSNNIQYYKKGFLAASVIKHPEVQKKIIKIINSWNLFDITNNNVEIPYDLFRDKIQKNYTINDSVCHYIEHYFGSKVLYDCLITYPERTDIKTNVLKNIICDLILDGYSFSSSTLLLHKDIIFKDIFIRDYPAKFLMGFSSLITGIEKDKILEAGLLKLKKPEKRTIDEIIKMLCGGLLRLTLTQNIANIEMNNIVTMKSIDDIDMFKILLDKGFLNKKKITLQECDDILTILNINFSVMDFVEYCRNHEKTIRILENKPIKEHESIDFYDVKKILLSLKEYQAMVGKQEIDILCN